MKNTLILSLLFFISVPASIARGITPDDSVKKTSRIHTLIIPVLFNSLETKWATGASGSLSFNTSHKVDSLTRTSFVQGIAMFTQRRQNIQALNTTIYFPKEKYIFSLQAAHSYFPDKFWGIGGHTKYNKSEDYKYSQIYFLSQLKRKLMKSLFAGIIYEFQKIYDLSYLKNDVFDTSIIYGKTDHLISGLGTNLCYDTRNSSFWPTHGIFIQYSYRAAVKSFLNSSFTNTKTTLDVRYFKNIRHSVILAIQFYNVSNYGETPIRELAMLGGANNLRGFYQGRFRDLKMSTLIGECRFPVYKKFSACVFNGLGYVYHIVNHVDFSSPKISYGLGVRYSILPNEKLNIRIDYGFADKHNKGLYFTLGECF